MAVAPTRGEWILALDQGTTNTKALVVDAQGAVHAHASVPVSITAGGGGRVEQDAGAIWRASHEVLASCVDQVGPAALAGLAITNQRESVVAWDRRSGAPVGPMLSWQDARTADELERLGADRPQQVQRVAALTGLHLDPMFSASKIAWLLSRADAGTIVGTVDSWLLWNLSGGGTHLIEAGNASRTLLLGLESLAWEVELLDLFGLHEQVLPRVVSSVADFPTVSCPGLPAGLPVLAVMADSHAALRGHGGGIPEVVKATFGTGSSVMRGTGDTVVRRPGISSTLAWLGQSPCYAVEGNIRYAGAALEWTAELLGLSNAHELGRLAQQAGDSGGVTLVPAFGGLGAPHWQPSATGIISGLDRGSSRAHLARAAFECVALQVADVVSAMDADDLPHIAALRADGGASASELLMQLQADILDIAVEVSPHPEVAAWGVAALAFERLGCQTDLEVGSTRYSPSAHDPGRHARWRSALAQSTHSSRTPSTTPIGARP